MSKFHQLVSLLRAAKAKQAATKPKRRVILAKSQAAETQAAPTAAEAWDRKATAAELLKLRAELDDLVVRGRLTGSDAQAFLQAVEAGVKPDDGDLVVRVGSVMQGAQA
ncbi:hypothetical protein [Methylobacterium sp. 22177]|uniref:hypothetical protein n=1 Tax=Methylobacterium sp. 22177 TaxID=3453885 RepID=UPI003F847485